MTKFYYDFIDHYDNRHDLQDEDETDAEFYANEWFDENADCPRNNDLLEHGFIVKYYFNDDLEKVDVQQNDFVLYTDNYDNYSTANTSQWGRL